MAGLAASGSSGLAQPRDTRLQHGFASPTSPKSYFASVPDVSDNKLKAADDDEAAHEDEDYIIVDAGDDALHNLRGKHSFLLLILLILQPLLISSFASK